MPQTSLTVCVVLAVFLFAIFTPSCKKPTDPPPPPIPPLGGVQLDVLNVSCTEAWVRLGIAGNISSPTSVVLIRDSITLGTFTFWNSETTLVDDGLLPSTSYTYHAQRISGSFFEPVVSTVTTTLDTTSSNWVFDPLVLLGDGSSGLYDVAIINDTLAYAVGEIYKRDSLGNWDPQPYNLARWNGSNWTIQKAPYYHQGQPFYSPIQAVFAFSADDIWFGIGNLIHWNGQSFSSVALPPQVWGPYRINKIWGHDGEIWIVGNGGSIAHRNATGTWRRLESGTTLPIRAIWGARDSSSGEVEILCIASDAFVNQGKRLLRIGPDGITQLPDSGLSWDLNTVWHIPRVKYMIGGDGVYHSRTIGPIWYRDTSFPPYYKTSIRGNGVNDIFVAGYRLLLHWNGYRWTNLYDAARMPDVIAALAISGDMMVAVGDRKITVGRR